MKGFMDRFSEGLESNLERSGDYLSGGERQKIAAGCASDSIRGGVGGQIIN